MRNFLFGARASRPHFSIAGGTPALHLLCFFGVTAALSGCGNNPYPPRESAGPILFYSKGDDPRTLDPTISYTSAESSIVDAIYPAYFHYNYLKQTPFQLDLEIGATEPVKRLYVPEALQKKYPDMFFTKDTKGIGEEWVFNLRDDLRFADDPCFPAGKGRKVVAADVIYAFRRMADPQVECPVVSFFADKIIGFDKYIAANLARVKNKQKADYNAPVEGLYLDPKDPLVFHIRLREAYPQLKYLMAMHFTTPIAREAAEKYGKELARHPVGCGQYILSEYLPKRRMALTPNPNRYPAFYPRQGEAGDAEKGWLQDAGKQLPLNKKVVLTSVKESTTGWNMFLQGYLDAYGVTQENFSQVVSRQGQLSPDMKAKGITMRKVVTPSIYYMLFNMTDPVVGGYSPQKRKLRQAISLAIDSQAIINLLSQGQGKSAEYLIPPGLFGYDKNYKNPYRRYDPKLTRAKQLLKEAGYPGGKDAKSGERLTLYNDNTATTAAGRQFVGLLEKQITALGIKFVSRPARPVVWQERVDKGQWQFIRYGWLADYPDPENFVFLLYGPNKRPGPNHTAYDNPAYNKLFEQMRAMEDSPQRAAIINKMRAISVEDCPIVYLSHDESLALSYDWIHNAKPHPIANDIYQYRRPDGAERAASQVKWNRPIVWPLLVAIALLVVGSIPAAATVQKRRTRRLRRDSHDETGVKN